MDASLAASICSCGLGYASCLCRGDDGGGSNQNFFNFPGSTDKKLQMAKICLNHTPYRKNADVRGSALLFGNLENLRRARVCLAKVFYQGK